MGRVFCVFSCTALLFQFFVLHVAFQFQASAASFRVEYFYCCFSFLFCVCPAGRTRAADDNGDDRPVARRRLIDDSPSPQPRRAHSRDTVSPISDDEPVPLPQRAPRTPRRALASTLPPDAGRSAAHADEPARSVRPSHIPGSRSF